MDSIHSVHSHSSSSLALPKKEEANGSLVDLITVAGMALSLGCACAQTVGLSQYAANRGLGNCEQGAWNSAEYCFPTFSYGAASLGCLASVAALRYFAEGRKSVLPDVGRVFVGFSKANLNISSAVLAWYSARNALEWTSRYFDGCTSSRAATLESLELDATEENFKMIGLTSQNAESAKIRCDLQATTITDHCKSASQRAAVNGFGFFMIGTAALTCAFAPTLLRKIAGLFSGVDRQPEAAQQKPEDKKRVA